VEPWLFLGLALALGVKHAFDPDHLVAVGNFVTRAPSARRAARLGLWWALGHMATAGVLTIGLFLARDQLAAGFLDQLDVYVVAPMLLAIGFAALAMEARAHTHRHRHGSVEHEHAHAHLFGDRAHRALLGIGLLHGLASNDELLLLLTASLGVVSLAGLLAGVGAFSVGVVAGMVLFAAAFALPLVRARSDHVRRAVNVAAGATSLAVGASMLLPLA
jgi:ABC-type nickel/cobalt efflux system permease component RcnA